MHRRRFLSASAQAALAAGLLPPVLAACGRKGDSAGAPANDSALVALRDRYFLKMMELNPVTATYLGADAYDPSLAQVNGRLRDWRPEAMEAERRFLDQVEADRRQIPVGDLSTQARIDHALLGAQVAFLVRQHERRSWQRVIDSYVAEPFRGVDWQIQGMTDTTPPAPADSTAADSSKPADTTKPKTPPPAPRLGTEAEWALVITRVGAIPAYLEAAAANLKAGRDTGNLPDHRMVARDGVGGSKANAEYFGKTLPAEAAVHLGDQPFAKDTLARLTTACRAAADAWERFAGVLLTTYDAGDVTDRFALGEEEYAWRVKTCLHLDRPLEDLFAYGADEVAHYEQQLFAVAREVAATAGLAVTWDSDAERRTSARAVMEHLGKDAPKDDDELFAWYREAGARAVAWGREQGLFTLPPNYRLDVVPTPPVLRSTIDAAYYPAPPFKQNGVGRFYLTPTGNDPATLALNNRASVADTAVHEGFPGHDWHYKYMTRFGQQSISNIRWFTPGAVEDSSAMWSDSMASEGWALYAEELMAAPTDEARYGFYTAPEMLYQLQGQLMRAVRVRVDIGIHTGRMTYDQAVDYFVEHVGFYPGARAAAAKDPEARALMEGAERAIYRYSKWPTQAITYNLGKREIQDLKAEVRRREGEGFSARDFHERLMKMGTVPASYTRAAFLGTATA